MGQNSSSSNDKVDDVKRQIGGDDNDQPIIYDLLNVKDGGGKLIDLIKQSRSSSCGSMKIDDIPIKSIGKRDSQHSSKLPTNEGHKIKKLKSIKIEIDNEIDEQISGLVKPLLYNRGAGKWFPVSQVSMIRFGCDEKHFFNSKLYQSEQSNNTIDSEYSFKQKKPTRFKPKTTPLTNNNDNQEMRLVCWKLDERGFCGETALHICFLKSTTTHFELARRLLRLFPNLINDIYTNDVYFGESALVSSDCRQERINTHYN